MSNQLNYTDPEVKEHLVRIYASLRCEMPDADRPILLEMARRMLHAQFLWDWQMFKINLGLDKQPN